MAVNFQKDIQMQCKHTWTYLELFVCGNKIYVFSTATSLIFS